MKNYTQGVFKTLLKKSANTISLMVVLPLFLCHRMAVLLKLGHSTFQSMTQLLSLFPGKTGSYLRKAFLHFVNASSLDCVISFGTIFSHPDIQIGDGAYIGPYCSLGRVSVGRDVLISGHVTILSGKGQHHFDDLERPIREQGGTYEKITIGDDSWIGSGAVIAANIGTQCIIGAGTIVLKDLEAKGVYLGNPARLVRKREG